MKIQIITHHQALLLCFTLLLCGTLLGGSSLESNDNLSPGGEAVTDEPLTAAAAAAVAVPVAPAAAALTNTPLLQGNGVVPPPSPPKKAGLIVKGNYTFETHTVTTEDGYILTLHRIPGGPASVPVLLQHGLLCSSEGWLVSEKSLAYILADHGYDVWLGNIRGNTFSRKHQTLSTSDPQFWNFTWEEQGRYDLPAFVTYITQLKNDKLFYVGHSMGATTFSVMAIEKPEIAKNVKAAIGLAPATYMYHIRSPLKLIAPFSNIFERTLHALGINAFLPRNFLFDFLANYICESSILQNVVCGNLLFLSSGFNFDGLDSKLLPAIWSFFPAGTSVKLYTHWMQQMYVNEFRKFDYGKKGNLQMYNSDVPPTYDLSKVQVPVAVFWSKNDWLVGGEDAFHYYEQLSYKLGIYKVDDDSFNHFDFLWGLNGPELLHEKILDVFDDYENLLIKI